MFDKPTVFILGAGASWHYGYPTGEDLVKAVISKAGYFAEFCERTIKAANVEGAHVERPNYIKRHMKEVVNDAPVIMEQWKKTLNECRDLKERLALTDPPVIDYFLQHNKEAVGDIGKLLIAWVILECEWNYRSHGFKNPNRLPKKHTPNFDWNDYQDNGIGLLTINF